jgi:coatomer protein complex subunit alpha (xenin)
VVVDSRKEADEVKELLEVAKEYALALRMQMKRKETALKDDLLRHSELAAYFTHCQLLQFTHLKLSAMSTTPSCRSCK